MKYIFTLLLTACATNIPKPTGEHEQYVVKGLTSQAQEQKLWCAAAVTRMMLSKHGLTPKQCELASKYHGEDCCNKLSVKCTKEVAVEDILPHYGIEPVVSGPSFDLAWENVKRGHPVAIYHYQGAGTSYSTGHSVVAYWAYIANGKKYLVVYDPITDSKKFWDKSYETGNLAWYRMIWMK